MLYAHTIRKHIKDPTKQSNVWRCFLPRYLKLMAVTYFRKKNSVVDICQGCKYTSVEIYLLLYYRQTTLQ